MLNDDLSLILFHGFDLSWKIGLNLCWWIDDSSCFIGWDWVERL